MWWIMKRILLILSILAIFLSGCCVIVTPFNNPFYDWQFEKNEPNPKGEELLTYHYQVTIEGRKSK